MVLIYSGNKRYALAPPIHNGNAYWEVQDFKLGYSRASIDKDVPNAEKFATEIFVTLCNEEQ